MFGTFSLLLFYLPKCMSVSQVRPFSIVLLLASLLLLPAPVSAQDVHYEASVAFSVKKARDAYQLTAKHNVAVEFLTEDATTSRIYTILEPYYATIENLRGDIYDEEGRTVNRLPDKSFHFVDQEDVFLSDYKQHVLEFPPVLEPGHRITYEYESQYQDIGYLPLLHIPNVDSVTTYTITVSHPPEVAVTPEFFFPRETLPYEIDRTPRQTTIEVQGGTYQPLLSYFAHNYYQASILLHLTAEGTSLTPTTPEALGQWYWQVLKPDALLNDADVAHLRTLVDTLASPLAQVQALHDYVRENIRYIADMHEGHTIIPRQPSQVLERGYGDCKDRAFLIATMAKRLGLEVDLVLVNTEPMSGHESVHVSHFNHMICHIRHEERSYFFDPTAKYVSFGDLPAGDINPRVLILSENAPRWSPIEAPNSAPHLDVTIRTGFDAPETGLAEIVFRNDFFAAAAQARAELTGVDLENFLSNLTTGLFYKLSLDNFQFVTADANSITFAASADLSKFVIASPTKRYIPKTPFRTVDSELLTRRDDPYPIYTSGLLRLALRLELDVAGFTPPAPDTTTLGDPALVWYAAASDTSDANTVWLDFTYTQNTKRVAPENRDAYLDFAQAYLKRKRDMFIFPQRPE